MRVSLRHTHAPRVHQQLFVRETAGLGDAGLVARGAQQLAARALPHEQSVHRARRRYDAHSRLSRPVLHGRGLARICLLD